MAQILAGEFFDACRVSCSPGDGCAVAHRERPAEAVGTRHAFRLQGDEYPGPSYCTFDSYAQCQATASGRLLQCIANPYFAGISDDPRATPYPYPQRPWVRPRPPASNPFAPLPNLFEFREN